MEAFARWPRLSLASFFLSIVSCRPYKLVDPALDDGGVWTPTETPDGGFAVGGVDGATVAPAPRPPTSGEQCAEEAVRGELVPVDLMLVLDASGSMNDDVGGRTRWEQVAGAMVQFAADSRSAGLGLGFQTFPFRVHDKPCAADSDCSGKAGECGQPYLCYGADVLPATAATCDPVTRYCDRPDTRCVASGRCSGSFARCVNLGEPCPGGGASDVCERAPLLCQAPVDSCQGDDYLKPKVPITVLPGALAELSRGLGAVRPAGLTPIAAAVEGAARYLQQHLGSPARRRGALVLVTDAVPNGCDRDDIESVAAVLDRARTGRPSLLTYVIAAVSPDQPVREASASRLAQAGGGGTPVVLNNEAPDLGDKLLAALNTIRGSALPCDLAIPSPPSGIIDYNKVNVRYNGPAGPVDLLYVGSAAGCDPTRGGWYYDIDPAQGTPTTVRVCEATCRRFKTDPGGSVELRFGCRTRID